MACSGILIQPTEHFKTMFKKSIYSCFLCFAASLKSYRESFDAIANRVDGASGRHKFEILEFCH